jgi:3-oxoacyl-[acyl-carrier protein] reductase
VPAGRIGTPQDVAYAVSFLASEAARFISGQRILVGGGRSLAS